MIFLTCFASIAGAQSLPSGWSGANIGLPLLPGSASASASTFTVSGSGTDIWGTSDQFFYAYRQISGDIDVIARVMSVEDTNAWAKAGVMIRASLNANAAHATMLGSAGKGWSYQRRPATGQNSVATAGGSGTAPGWIKLERRGSAVTAFKSANGTTWTMIGSQTLTLPTTFYVGLAVTSHNILADATAVFENVLVQAASNPNQPPTVSLTAPANNATYTAPASVALAATASDPDDGVAQVEFFSGQTLIGTDTTSPYQATWSNVPAGTYTLTAVARDQTGARRTSAARTITVSQGTPSDTTPPTAAITSPASGATVSGTVTLSANASDNIGVASVTFRVDGTVVGSADTTAPYSVAWNTSGAAAGSHAITAEAADAAGNRGTSATVTVNIAAANQPPVVALTAPANGATYTAPATVSLAANASDANDSIAQVQFFAGSTLIGTDTSSPYTATWSNAPAGSHSLTAVARDASGATTTSAARTITVQASTPSAWTGADIGTTGVPGTMSDNGASLTVNGAGGDIWRNSDNFYYVYRAVSGDLDIITRVASEENVDPWTKAGPMVRGTLAATSVHTSIFVTPGNGVTFLRRQSSGGSSVSTPSGAGAAPVWLKLERRGSAITAFRSADGTTWSMVGSETMTLPQTFYVGFAVASQNANNAATVVLDNVTFRPVNAGPQAPTVSLTAPANGATFTAPATITVSASAADTDDGVAQVEFFAGQTLIGTDTSSPYSVTWSDVPAGSYSVTAVARDNGGLTTTSAARSITVATADTTPPSASITAPANGATVSGTVTVTANASDNVGLASVTFRADGNVIGSADTTAPYSVAWNTTGLSGSHTLTAEAADAAGNRTMSAAVTVTVSGPANQPPSAALTAPANGATFTAPASIAISATASDTDGSIAQVDFYNGTTLLGSDTSSPYSFTWSNVPAGVYSLTAVARDNAGATTTSASRSVTVNNAPMPSRAIFNASSNHDTAVTRYQLEIFTNGANPNTATPVQTQDLGKPAVANGAECDVNIASTIQSLPNGTYIATIIAIGPGGSARSAASAAFTR